MTHMRKERKKRKSCVYSDERECVYACAFCMLVVGASVFIFSSYSNTKAGENTTPKYRYFSFTNK